MILLCLLASLLLIPTGCAGSRTPPSPPVWPDQFTSNFTVLVEKYGPSWSSKGVIYYDWTNKTFRADYVDWCLPLFETGPTDQNNYTCTFLATGGSMYFINHTASQWQDNQCCLFDKGLSAVPPDWVKNCQYNGTTVLRNTYCDVWWFPGTSDPNKPYYGYWDAANKTHTPMQFFGLSSLGPTFLEYTTFDVGPANVPLDLPNHTTCFKQCEPPSQMKKAYIGQNALKLPHFPSYK